MQRKLIRQYRAFHFLHLSHLASLAEFADDETASQINRLRNCWPMGVMVEWSGPGQKTSRDVCNKAWQCPWCFGRRVVDLHDKILEGPLASGGTGIFVLATVDVPIDSSSQYLSNTRQFRAFQQRVRKAMVERLKICGATGGIVTSQLGPRRITKHDWESGEVTASMHDGFDLHVGVLGEITRRSGAERRTVEPLNIQGLSVRFQISIQKGRPGQRLRHLLAGHSRAYSGDQRLADSS